MLRSVRVTRVGDTDFLICQAIGEQVDRFRFMEENEKVMNRGGALPTAPHSSSASPKPRSQPTASSPPPHSRRPPECSPKPASPAESTTCAALKENVIVGRLIPAGTGMPVYREVDLEKDGPIPVQPNLEDLLRAETDDEAEETLSLPDFDDEQ
jgi:DNA-directed RNA polymerase subunit beta'